MLEEQKKVVRICRYLSELFVVSLTVILVTMFSSRYVIAQEQIDVESNPQVVVNTDFIFNSEPCDSLTKLVRRSLLVYDQENNEIELSQAGIIFAETNIVQTMGAYLLDIGDEVIISYDEVSEYAHKSLELSNSQIAAWSVYIPDVDFGLSHTQQPTNLQEFVDEVSGDLLSGEPADDIETDESNSVSAVWWIIGVGSVVVVWYLLWHREEV
jgi:hypothetical protein